MSNGEIIHIMFDMNFGAFNWGLWMIFRVGELFQSNLIPGMIICWKEYKMDLGGHMVPRAEWATFGVPRVWGGWGGWQAEPQAS